MGEAMRWNVQVEFEMEVKDIEELKQISHEEISKLIASMGPNVPITGGIADTPQQAADHMAHFDNVAVSTTVLRILTDGVQGLPARISLNNPVIRPRQVTD